MSRIIHNLEISLDQDIEEKLLLIAPNFGDYRILKKSIDARRRHAPHFIYSVEVSNPGEKISPPHFSIDKVNHSGSEIPIIIGTGPAGLFAALRLIERGIPCKLFERGSRAEERIHGINQFWRYGKLNPRNNVCFGEGGAGLYSDGKLITRIKSPHIPYVLQRLVQFGAPEEIMFLSNPHVGSDKIRRIIPKIREFLLTNGCKIYYDTQIKKILVTKNPKNQVYGVETEYGEQHHSHHVVLATGHSAEDTLRHLYETGVQMEGKSFALGLRIEHPQKLINKIQYRDFSEHPKLGAANYRLAHHDPKTQIGVYSFCMCPGGYVLSSGTESDGLVCNGMSNFNRSSSFANSAIVVSIDFKKIFSSTFEQTPFDGFNFRRDLEFRAHQEVLSQGGFKQLPVQKVTDFLLGRQTTTLLPGSCPSGIISARLDKLLPAFISKKIQEGLEVFDRSMKGFSSEQAQLYGIESRTSCPIRIPRHDHNLQSLSHFGLYPCGEGAGYAGGITSAACDGIRVAESIAQQLAHLHMQTFAHCTLITPLKEK